MDLLFGSAQGCGYGAPIDGYLVLSRSEFCWSASKSGPHFKENAEDRNCFGFRLKGFFKGILIGDIYKGHIRLYLYLEAQWT